MWAAPVPYPTQAQTSLPAVVQAVSHDAAEYEHPLSSRVSSLDPLAHSQSLKHQVAEANIRKEVCPEHRAMAPQLPVECCAVMPWDVPCSSVCHHPFDAGIRSRWAPGVHRPCGGCLSCSCSLTASPAHCAVHQERQQEVHCRHSSNDSTTSCDKVIGIITCLLLASCMYYLTALGFSHARASMLLQGTCG